MKQVRYGLQAVMLLLALLVLSSPCLAGHGEQAQDKTGILIVAFGTTVPEARDGFALVDKMVKQAFPDVPVRWAYTSKIVRNKVAKEEGTELRSEAQALADMMDEDFTRIAVLSLHTIPGEEYCALVDMAKAFSSVPGGPEVVVSAPLLGVTEDHFAAIKALLTVLPKERKPGDVVVLMGHGTPHPADVSYAALQYHLWKADPNILVGTVEGNPTLDDVLAELKERKAKKVFLLPFMSVAGDHARNDMAGDEDDSWKSILTKAGYEVVPVLKGTSEYAAFDQLWVDHLKAAFDELQ